MTSNGGFFGLRDRTTTRRASGSTTTTVRGSGFPLASVSSRNTPADTFGEQTLRDNTYLPPAPGVLGNVAPGRRATFRQDPPDSQKLDPISTVSAFITLRPVLSNRYSFTFEPLRFQLLSGGTSVHFLRSDRTSVGPAFFRNGKVWVGSRVISRDCHAQMWYEDGVVYIQDGGSSSGTWVNDEPAPLSPLPKTVSQPRKIRNGAVVRLGQDVSCPEALEHPQDRLYKSMAFSVSIEPVTPEVTLDTVTFHCEEDCPCSWRVVLDRKGIFSHTRRVRGVEAIFEALRVFMGQPTDSLANRLRTWSEAETGIILSLIERITERFQNQTEEQRLCLSFTRKIARQTGVLPPTFVLRGVQKTGEYAVAGGGAADIWDGTYSGKRVAIKVLRIFISEGETLRLTKDIIHEALFWKRLDHPHIVPFLGLTDAQTFPSRLGFVCPWMPNGNILDFINRNSNVDKLPLLAQAAQGLCYLHACHLTHGDIKGANMLIDENGTVRLSDFGLTTLSDTQTLGVTSTESVKGSIRWMAPELFAPQPGVRRSFTSDVYAFGVTIIEVWANQIPMPQLGDMQIMLAVINGTRPSKPSHPIGIASDQLWLLANRCWDVTPSARPTMREVTDSLDDQLSYRPMRSQTSSTITATNRDDPRSAALSSNPTITRRPSNIHPDSIIPALNRLIVLEPQPR